MSELRNVTLGSLGLLLLELPLLLVVDSFDESSDSNTGDPSDS
jgi:hypothetical protein